MIGWLVAAATAALAVKYVKDGKAEKSSFQRSGKDNNYSRYVTMQVISTREYEAHIYVDGLLFCRTHRESPYGYLVNDIPVGSKLSVYRKYAGRSELALFSECIVKPGPGVEVYTRKRGNPAFDRGLWVNTFGDEKYDDNDDTIIITR